MPGKIRRQQAAFGLHTGGAPCDGRKHGVYRHGIAWVTPPRRTIGYGDLYLLEDATVVSGKTTVR